MWNFVVVFVENKIGKLAAVTDLLAKNNINLLMLNVDDEGKYGVIHLLTNCPEKTRNVLYANNFTAALNKVALVEIADKPGELSNLLRVLSEEGINLRHILGCTVEAGVAARYILVPEGGVESMEEKLNARGIKLVQEL